MGRRQPYAGLGANLVKPFTLEIFTDRLQAYLAQREQLRRAAGQAANGPLDQAHVDQLLGSRRNTTRVRLPKGLSEQTLALVASTLTDAGSDISAAQIGERTGLSRISARRYLEYLAESGRATVAPQYGTAGRSAHRYRWAERSEDGRAAT